MKAKFFWKCVYEEIKVRPCEWYKEEFKDCRSIRARMHQYFVYGESIDCSQWKTDYQNCMLFRNKKDIKALMALPPHVWYYRKV
ncbi:UPF0545 protein C22orf39 homolog isoform X2 [Stegodyphus dumicola]|uniref:UPF0545 protein C22orf39 homolog isoform X2 n=1 Tax=Stegodyphus dumicola TaxID=202533 RepID=UPI0015A75CEA|nr:UPF0545 protein C22orf39 homolog isoform X2 [Stegodyphus dumicola]